MVSNPISTNYLPYIFYPSIQNNTGIITNFNLPNINIKFVLIVTDFARRCNISIGMIRGGEINKSRYGDIQHGDFSSLFVQEISK